MRIFPVVKGQIEINTTKEDFIAKLRKVTEADYPLIRATSVSYDERLREYARELYEDSFMLWKIPSPGMKLSPFLFTTIHGRLIEIENKVILKYHIRFNLGACLLTLAILLVSFYLLYEIIFVSVLFDLKSWVLLLISYPLEMWVFNDCASDDEKFLKKLTK